MEWNKGERCVYVWQYLTGEVNENVNVRKLRVRVRERPFM